MHHSAPNRWPGTSVLVLLAMSIVSVAAGDIVHVDDDAPPGGDGRSWETAFRFLQDAFDPTTGPGTLPLEIRIAAGTHRPDRSERTPAGSGDRHASFIVPDGALVRGGYLGLGAGPGEDPDTRNVERYVTVLSGDLNDDDATSRSDNSLHVVWTFETGAGTLLEGLTITAGHAELESPQNTMSGLGGGIYAHNSAIQVRDCRLEGNHAWRGGGAYGFLGAPTFEGTQFIGNESEQGGGGLLLTGDGAVDACAFEGNDAAVGGAMLLEGVPTITACTFADNTAVTGGGVAVAAGVTGSPVLTGCGFTGNAAEGDGGALAILRRTPLVTGCAFTSNTANRGGAVSVGTVCLEVFPTGGTFDDCVFDGNSADLYGGAVLCACEIDLDADGCEFAGNVAGHAGGAWANLDSDPAISASSFTGNVVTSPVGEGGAISNMDGSSPTISGSLFTGNHADTGGAIANFLDASPAVDGCTFQDNTARAGGAISSFVGGTPSLVGSTFIANTAEEDGGAVRHRLVECAAIDCTFALNEAHNGGAVAIVEAGGVLEGCTFASNGAMLWGGAVRGEDAHAIEVDGCVFALNSVQKQAGGGIRSDGELLTVRRSDFRDNSGHAGAVEVLGDHALLEACTFDANEGGFDGPVTIRTATAGIADCHFTGNVGDAGAIDLLGTVAAIHGCTFENNLVSAGIGGGVVHGGAWTITQCVFTGNGGFAVHAPSGSGGSIEQSVFQGTANGIRHGGSLPIAVVGCTFSDLYTSIFNLESMEVRDCAFGDVGQGIWNRGTLTVVDSTFDDAGDAYFADTADASAVLHRCRLRGGDHGIHARKGALTLSSSLVEGNAVALRLLAGTWIIAGCTIVDNAAGIADSSITPTSGLLLVDSILRSSPIVASSIDGAVVHCDIEGGWSGAGFGNIDADPLFADPAAGDFRLLPGSPCIDAGHDWGVPLDEADVDGDGDDRELLPGDLDNSPRFADGPGADVGCGLPVIVDIGAFEHPGDPAVDVRFGDVDGDLVVGVGDLMILLAAWGPCREACCLSDLDLDGVVDVRDLVALVLAWAPDAE